MIKKVDAQDFSYCGWVYDEETEGTKFTDLPDDYVCPICGAGKDEGSVWYCGCCCG